MENKKCHLKLLSKDGLHNIIFKEHVANQWETSCILHNEFSKIGSRRGFEKDSKKTNIAKNVVERYDQLLYEVIRHIEK